MEFSELWSYDEIETLRPEKLYLVKHKKTGKLAVQKVVREESLPVYEALCNIRHRNLPEIFGCFVVGGQAVILREYIEGTSLQESINKGTVFDKKQIRDIGCQLCEALHVLHKHKPAIIHRDVKRSNVLVDKNGVVKLLDFDAARFYDEKQDRDTELIGTHGYAAPEQYGFSQTDARTDIYATGVLLEKLCGERQFLGSIVKKCKNMNPRQRYSGMPILKNAIKRNRYKKIAIPVVSILVIAVIAIGIMTRGFGTREQADFSNLVGTWSWKNENTTTELIISADEKTGLPVIESLYTEENYGSHRSATLMEYSILEVGKDSFSFTFEDSYFNRGTMTARYDLNYDCLYLSSDSGGELGSTVGQMPFYKGAATFTDME